MIIYIVQDSGFNFSSLLKLSENIVTVANRDYPLFGDASEHVEKIKQVLKHFDVNKDAIVPAGDPINISIVANEIFKKGGGPVLFLKWDRQSGVYVPVKVMANNEPK
jgi:hypothetical protein